MTGWTEARALIGHRRLTLGPQASAQWLTAPDHLAMVLSRYRAAASLLGSAQVVLEVGCGEGIGSRILAAGRGSYFGIDPDPEAIEVAEETADEQDDAVVFSVGTLDALHGLYDAVVALDVIEHFSAEHATHWIAALCSRLTAGGVCVIGTPNAAFDHLASPASVAGHVTTYTHEQLYALLRRHFRIVQSFGMQDTALHLGHPEARHYLLMSGVGPHV